jgi:hypothetical protein
MKKPTKVQTDAAWRLFELEDHGVEGENAAAAGRMHQKMFARLATLLGAGGARALFARSVKLTMTDFPCLRSVDFDATPPESAAEKLVTCLRGEAPAAATDTAVALCAQVLALLSTLIGERLTSQVLRSVWPTFVFAPPNEET